MQELTAARGNWSASTDMNSESNIVDHGQADR